MTDSDIKAIIPVVCPHCSKTLAVEFLLAANLLSPEAAAKILAEVNPEPPKPEEEEA